MIRNMRHDPRQRLGGKFTGGVVLGKLHELVGVRGRIRRPLFLQDFLSFFLSLRLAVRLVELLRLCVELLDQLFVLLFGRGRLLLWWLLGPACWQGQQHGQKSRCVTSHVRILQFVSPGTRCSRGDWLRGTRQLCPLLQRALDQPSSVIVCAVPTMTAKPGSRRCSGSRTAAGSCCSSLKPSCRWLSWPGRRCCSHGDGGHGDASEFATGCHHWRRC